MNEESQLDEGDDQKKDGKSEHIEFELLTWQRLRLDFSIWLWEVNRPLSATQHLQYPANPQIDGLDHKQMDGSQFSLEDAMAQLPGPDGKRFATVFERGSLQVEIYAPRGRDKQMPHPKDELYVVMKGEGTFVNGAGRSPFKSGDVIFVPAGVVHRFEDFTDDLAVWVFFYGPEGGEKI